MTQPVSFNPVQTVRERRIASGPAAASPAAATTAAMPAAQVPLSRLTDLARQLAAEGPPVDHRRIAQISQAIASGSYRIDAAAIADAILRGGLSSDR